MEFTYKSATTPILNDLGVPRSFQNEIKDYLLGFPKIAYNLNKKVGIIPRVEDPFTLPSRLFVLFINDYSFGISEEREADLKKTKSQYMPM